MGKQSRKTLLLFCFLYGAILVVMSCDTKANKARYDNYRLVRLGLKTQEHVDIFQELEEESDSYTFYGHALNPDQNLTILVAAHKIFEIYDIVERYGIDYTVLVCILLKRFSYHSTTNCLGTQYSAIN